MKAKMLMIDERPTRDRDYSGSRLGMNQESQNVTSINDHTVNTLKEISDLKNEIIKLTTSLRSLKNSPEQKSKL